MRALFVAALLTACGTSDDVTLKNATDDSTCADDWMINGRAITQCDRACESAPNPREVAPCGLGVKVVVEGKIGVCQAMQNPDRVEWMACE